MYIYLNVTLFITNVCIYNLESTNHKSYGIPFNHRV